MPVPGPPEPERWQEQVREFAIIWHATMAAHSDIARVALANIPMVPELTSREYGERCEFGLDLLLDGLAARARRSAGSA